ncbi:type II toxin-antitoxin system RelE/ParE family toxin [Thalassolituus sp. UBA2590]|uniref:type II toxin-antitoxin system RelE/ParE family toxin n=1 Tax=Thalassolituus sp. UBA2590 TaxID=1947663 RepID=UPI002647640B|nr:type II toxin-antitoxin system RelE/ParE family toxin [Thalassolituus sp. UBA2590]|tara:strand:- start:392 stop:679 length:288 start_codon:yes stop_codon:yes gene_type:complete
MLNTEVSSEAENDLLSIWLYIAADQPINADRFLDKLLVAIERLAEFPLLGVEREELANGVRSFYVDRYVIYYVVSDASLSIVRVLSADMDSQQYF